ncbi:hypothetical protein [Segetibacter koreensis]|uniref:hypothetical protein n=1 Tax=Segetibacter koreensis TaxID=398037 RepID=UPI00037FE4D7|nr:hypothetical protein [Segetibacter koreensis]
MKRKWRLSLEEKITIACLIVAAAGVVLQIISGHPYPEIPPVFFILLIPAGLISFAPWRSTYQRRCGRYFFISRTFS